jgi:hypothetical protein
LLEEDAMKDDNVRGATTAFCTFTPFKSFWARIWHFFVLKGAPLATDKIRNLRFLHYMSFVTVTPKHLKRAQLPDQKRLRSGAMLFISAYNGAEDTYFRGFHSDLDNQMNSLWGGCVDWMGAEEYKRLGEFIAAYRRHSDFHFSAYPDASKNLRVALRLRAGLDDLIDVAHRDSKQEFLKAYRQLAQVVWGKPCGEGSAS